MFGVQVINNPGTGSGSWALNGNSGLLGTNWFSAISSQAALLSVSATPAVSAVPEPSTYTAFAGFAALALVTLRRRRTPAA